MFRTIYTWLINASNEKIVLLCVSVQQQKTEFECFSKSGSGRAIRRKDNDTLTNWIMESGKFMVSIGSLISFQEEPFQFIWDAHYLLLSLRMTMIFRRVQTNFMSNIIYCDSINLLISATSRSSKSVSGIHWLSFVEKPFHFMRYSTCSNEVNFRCLSISHKFVHVNLSVPNPSSTYFFYYIRLVGSWYLGFFPVFRIAFESTVIRNIDDAFF